MASTITVNNCSDSMGLAVMVENRVISSSPNGRFVSECNRYGQVPLWQVPSWPMLQSQSRCDDV